MDERRFNGNLICDIQDVKRRKYQNSECQFSGPRSSRTEREARKMTAPIRNSQCKKDHKRRILSTLNDLTFQLQVVSGILIIDIFHCDFMGFRDVWVRVCVKKRWVMMR